VTDPMVCSSIGTACHQHGLQECTVYGGLQTALKTKICTKHICAKLAGKKFFRFSLFY